MFLLNVNLSVYANFDSIIAIFVHDFLITDSFILEINIARVVFHICFQMSDLWFYKNYFDIKVKKKYKNQIMQSK